MKVAERKLVIAAVLVTVFATILTFLFVVQIEKEQRKRETQPFNECSQCECVSVKISDI